MSQDKPLDLPPGWVERTLSDLADNLDSRRVPVNKAERAKRPGTVPYYGATGQVGWIDEPVFDEELCLVGEDGAPFLDRGKTKAYVISGPSWVNNHAHVLRALAEVTTNRFLKHVLDVTEYRPYVNGTTRLKLTKSALNQIPIPLPPLNEQRRIVAAIEKHLSRLDAADAWLAAATRRLRALRAVALRAAFDLEADAVTIGAIAKVGSGATPKRGRPEYWESGTIPWVTSGQLNASPVSEPAALITDRALHETNVKLWPPGTLLVALYGEGQTRGRCAELTFEATTNQACAAVVLDEDVADRAYVRRYFDASYEANRRLASGGVQPNLSLGLVRAMQIPLPALDEQRRIVALVEEQLSSIDALRAAIERAQRRSQSLRRAILERAFRGELVPQDPTDEPASVLLERIQAEGRIRDGITYRRGRRARISEADGLNP